MQDRNAVCSPFTFIFPIPFCVNLEGLISSFYLGNGHLRRNAFVRFPWSYFRINEWAWDWVAEPFTNKQHYVFSCVIWTCCSLYHAITVDRRMVMIGRGTYVTNIPQTPTKTCIHAYCIAASKVPQFCGRMRLCLFRKTSKHTYVLSKMIRQLHIEWGGLSRLMSPLKK